MTVESHTSDVGLIVGRYLQVLAAFSLASLILAPIFGHFYFDFSFILLFWAGAALVKRSQTARTILMPLFGMICLMGALMIILVLIRGTDGVTLNFGPMVVSNPPLGLAVCGLLLIMTLAGFPLHMLLTKEAVSQFKPEGGKSG